MTVSACVVQVAAGARELSALWDKVVLLQQREAFLKVLSDVVGYYVPSCFVIGWLVRSCYWEHRTAWTGSYAKRVLEYCVCVLKNLFAGQERRSEYLRSLTVALCTWTCWHDSLPACMHVEECNEALLSRLSHVLTRISSAATASEINDVFLTLPDVDLRPHSAATQMVRPQLRDCVLRNFTQLLNGRPSAFSFTPWTGSKTCRCTGLWDFTVTFPGAENSSFSALTQAVSQYLTVASRGERPTAAVVAWLDRHCGDGNAHASVPDPPGTVPADRPRTTYTCVPRRHGTGGAADIRRSSSPRLVGIPDL